MDDASIIGDLDICAGLKAKLSSLEDLKVQGILKNHRRNLVVAATIMLENTPVHVKDELCSMFSRYEDRTG